MAVNGNFPIGAAGDFDDWIEIYNDSDEYVDVAGLYLTDDRSNPTQWQFPSGRVGETLVRPKGFLLVVADNDLEAPGLHANFKLSSDGEEIALFASDGQQLLDSIVFDVQKANVSFGRDPQDAMQWRFLAWPSPGTANLPAYLGTVADPVFSHERGFYESPFSLTLTCDTPDATISYTTDGTDPLYGASAGTVQYGSPISISKTVCLRAVAMKPGWASSRVISHTFLYRMSDRYKSLPVISLVGNPGQTFYAPDGIMAIVGGRYSGGVWSPSTASSYNNVLEHGLERPLSMEVIDPDVNNVYQVDCGIRVHGSDWMRPRYTTSSKFSFRLYFRSEYGKKALDYPFYPFETEPPRSIVLRAGHNDMTNPFIKDELVRRLQYDMGHVSSRGIFANLFINGQYKGYFNPCEHITEAFCQARYDSTEDWDIITMFGSVREGDRVRADALMQYVRTHDLSKPEYYAEVDKQVDLVEFIDYLILRLWSGDWDWPQNNWSAASERSEQGKWRFFVWDAEGSMFSDRLNQVRYNELHNNSHENAILYNALFKSPQFKTLYGDRFQKHFFNDGALTETHIKDRFVEMQEEMRGVIPNMSTYVIDTWVPKRHSIFMEASKAEGVYTFPGPMPYINGVPQAQGLFQEGEELYLINPSGSSTIYYTVDGSDPTEHANTSEWDSVTLFSADMPKRVLVPTDDSVTHWTGEAFYNDSSWHSVSGLPGGVGYEKSTGYEPYISLDVQTEMASNTSCYVRIPFVASRNLNAYDVLFLNIQYDDGFVAYLNGHEVARRNAPQNLAWNSSATSNHDDGAATVFETIDLTAYTDYILRAENVVAIHGLNASTSSSDFLINAELKAGKGTPIEIDEKLSQYEGPIALTEATHIKARILQDNKWSSLAEMTFAMQSVVDGLRISEIMYHPPETGNPEDPNTEYIELMNISDKPIPLGLVRFTRGITFELPSIELAANDVVLIVKDSVAFENMYGVDLPVIGQYAGSLSNSGEWLELQDVAGYTIHRLQYKDDWHDVTDGDGYSLTLHDPTQAASDTGSDPALWRASAVLGGTPGWVD